jgi:hypothetical protein
MQFGSGGYLPPPHSTFGGCGLPHRQIAENKKLTTMDQKNPRPLKYLVGLIKRIFKMSGGGQLWKSVKWR